MITYRLYLESGPRRKKTMVHVPELLGCMANGPTTEDALAATPDAIRDFLFFLYRHGEISDAHIAFKTEIAAHFMEGVWLGNGDPSVLLDTDREHLSEEDLEKYIARLTWMGQDLRDLVGDLSTEELMAVPVPKGRPINRILEHVLESEYSYMYAFGRIPELPASGAIVEKHDRAFLDWIEFVRGKEFERLRALSEEHRNKEFIHWKYPRTARKVLRRMLEHHWEHLVEIRRRLNK